MGLFDALFSSSQDSDQGEPPNYIQNSYKKFGLDPDNELGPSPNLGKRCVLSAAKFTTAACTAPDAITPWQNGSNSHSAYSP